MSRDVVRVFIKALSWPTVTFPGPLLGFSWSGSVRGSRRASPGRVRQDAETAPSWPRYVPSFFPINGHTVPSSLRTHLLDVFYTDRSTCTAKDTVMNDTWEWTPHTIREKRTARYSQSISQPLDDIL